MSIATAILVTAAAVALAMGAMVLARRLAPPADDEAGAVQEQFYVAGLFRRPAIAPDARPSPRPP